MNDDVEIFFDNATGTCYLESLIKSRQILLSSGTDNMLSKINELIDLELDLAIDGAVKATSEVKKATVTPLKGV